MALKTETYFSKLARRISRVTEPGRILVSYSLIYTELEATIAAFLVSIHLEHWKRGSRLQSSTHGNASRFGSILLG